MIPTSQCFHANELNVRSIRSRYDAVNLSNDLPSGGKIRFFVHQEKFNGFSMCDISLNLVFLNSVRSSR